MNTRVYAVSFYQAETPLALIKPQLAIITHNTSRHFPPRAPTQTARSGDESTSHRASLKKFGTHTNLRVILAQGPW